MRAIICLLLILGFSQSTSAQNKVIYGKDNRLDYYQVDNAMFREFALSTAAMISINNLSFDGDIVEISSITLSEYGVCDGERFTSQLIPANCSGFLVGDDILVTAGHCMQSYSDCENFKWVFDFAVHHAGDDANSIASSSVYSCDEILTQMLDSYTKSDYAVIKLDRKVTGRAPLKFRTQGHASEGEDLVVIGHPTGLPTKIAAGAKVRSTNNIFFTANLDTFGGNSGSAVFNAQTGDVEGILVRGENDYRYNSVEGCYRPKQCIMSGCSGEDSTNITQIGLEDFI